MIVTVAAITAPTAVAKRPRPTPHRLGMLFEILDEMGEDPTFTFALARVGNPTPIQRLYVHHAESDGHGGLTRFLYEHRIGFESPRPRANEATPSLLERLRAIVRVVRHRG